MHLYQPKNIKINLPYSLEENEKMVELWVSKGQILNKLAYEYGSILPI